MEHKIIQTDNYLIVVDDSDIKEGDWYLRYNKSVMKCTKIKLSFNEATNKEETIILSKGCGDPYERSKKNIKKIIAHLPLNNSTILEGVDILPPIENDVEKLAKEEILYNDQKRAWWKQGYNKAKEKYKYTEEDMVECWKYASIDKFQIFGDQIGNSYMSFIQSIQQPKMPIGFKRKQGAIVISGGLRTGDKLRPAGLQTHIYYETTTNSQGNTQWVGEYIYD